MTPRLNILVFVISVYEVLRYVYGIAETGKNSTDSNRPGGSVEASSRLLTSVDVMEKSCA